MYLTFPGPISKKQFEGPKVVLNGHWKENFNKIESGVI